VDTNLVGELRRELAAAADAKYRDLIQRFFKEPIDVYGVRTVNVNRISREYFKRVKDLPKDEVFEMCELLHQGTRFEEHAIAFSWAAKLAAKFEPSDFKMLERWVKLHVSNWAACDTLCCGALGEFLVRFPKFLPKVQAWAKSRSRWLRRASAVAMILPARRGLYHDVAYKTADILLLDEDDMVQKGYGWMLKEISNRQPREVLDFVLKRKDRMPRTALRYAIEKLPPAWKKRAMAK
jgi:3-methyladenine DNA glycosylase AlkD